MIYEPGNLSIPAIREACAVTFKDEAYVPFNPKAIIELLDMLEAAQKDAARYRYISNLKHIWGVLGDRYNLPAEENGAGTLDESIDLAIEEIK